MTIQYYSYQHTKKVKKIETEESAGFKDLLDGDGHTSA